MTNVNVPTVVEFIGNLIKGNQFVGLHNYVSGTTNPKCITPSISNFNLSLGASYKNAKTKSIEILGNAQFSDNEWKNFENEEQFNTVLSALVKQIETPNKNSSNGQIEAYDRFYDGKIRVHKKTGRIFIFAKVNHKQVIEKGEYKPTKSRRLTLQKNEIKRFYNLPNEQWGNFAFDAMDIVKISGSVIEFK